MPRVTVKGSTAENALLRETLSDVMEENRDLRADLDARRDRSRSRHRKATFKVEPVSARTMMASDIVCERDRDHVIDEQKATIAKASKRRRSSA